MNVRSRLLRTSAALGVALALVGCNVDGNDADLAGDDGSTEEPSDESVDESPEAAAVADEESADADGADESGSEMSDDGSEESTDESAEPEADEETEADGSTSDSVPPNGEVVNVLSLDNSFREEVVEVEAGTEILWTNNGRNDHNVLPVDPDQEWGVEVEDFAPGDEYSHVFGTPGEYPYYCSIHGTETVGMVGTIVVTG